MSETTFCLILRKLLFELTIAYRKSKKFYPDDNPYKLCGYYVRIIYDVGLIGTL